MDNGTCQHTSFISNAITGRLFVIFRENVGGNRASGVAEVLSLDCLALAYRAGDNSVGKRVMSLLGLVNKARNKPVNKPRNGAIFVCEERQNAFIGADCIRFSECAAAFVPGVLRERIVGPLKEQ